MDYLDRMDEMSLGELLYFAESRSDYKEMMNSYEDIIAEQESRYDYEKEERQLEYLEEREV